MVGLTKPTSDQRGAYLEIDSSLVNDEEGQSLTANDPGRAIRSLGSPSNSSSYGGSISDNFYSLFYFLLDNTTRDYKKWGASFVAFLLLGMTYRVGKGHGRTITSGDVPAPPAAAVAYPSPSLTYDGGPTYKPTDLKAEEKGPTYKPTEAPPPADPNTPPPTFGNHSWIDPDYPNPHVTKFNTTEWMDFHTKQWEDRVTNAIDINTKYGSYCPKEPMEPMCPPLDATDAHIINVDHLLDRPLMKCIETGNKEERCGVSNPWLNKTIWPLIRGPFCANQNEERNTKNPMPEELKPYFELGYDRVDPTKSKDAQPFDGGVNQDTNNLLIPFDPTEVKEHFLKFEAMLENYYQGLARPLLERQIAPMPEDVLYAPMLKSYSDQIARALIRAGGDESSKIMTIGVLGDSVTAGQDNCYYDAWPEAFRRQISPLFKAMGLEVEVANGAKNGGWHLAPQMMCANDLLGISRLPNEVDFLFLCNPFVSGDAIDAEHLIRRALLGKSHTVLSMVSQKGMDQGAMLERYAEAGLTIGTPFQDAVPELGYPEKGHKYWFPNQQKAFWGMPGSGFCHLTTRSGSSSVVSRNWHWGPKMHQTYADAYALLFSRAARQAIDDLSAGRMPLEPRKPNEVDQVMQKKEEKEDTPPTWRSILLSDMGSEEAVQGGITGVRCAVGPANAAGSTLLPHWLRPAEGSPFEEKMKARNGVSFVPSDHDAEDSKFYKIQSPISSPNKAVDIGDWVADPKTYGAEAPRTAEQCRHVDGSTMVDFGRKPESGVSWLVWEVPKGYISIGHVMICIPRGAKPNIEEDAFEKGNVRFHYAVPDGNGGKWKVIEDSHKSKPFSFAKQECVPVVSEMNEGDLKAVRENGMWAAIEWKQEGIFQIDYLVAM